MELARPKWAGWGKDFRGGRHSIRKGPEVDCSPWYRELVLMELKRMVGMMADDIGMSGRRGKSVVGA